MTSSRPGSEGSIACCADHARGAIRLEQEADRDVGGGGRRADRIEGIAGVAREQLAMPRPARRPRRNLVERVLRQRQL